MAQKLRKPAVAERYGGVNTRTIDRWLADPELNFPRPIYIGIQPLWDQAELEEWERNRAAAPRRRSSRSSGATAEAK